MPASLGTFAVIGGGAIGWLAGGVLGDRWGRTRTTRARDDPVRRVSAHDRTDVRALTVQLAVGWSWAFALLAPGPALGVVAMLRLRGRPWPRESRAGAANDQRLRITNRNSLPNWLDSRSRFPVETAKSARAVAEPPSFVVISTKSPRDTSATASAVRSRSSGSLTFRRSSCFANLMGAMSCLVERVKIEEDLAALARRLDR